jgi:Mn2+/Fe2+ NRAMP family transporter
MEEALSRRGSLYRGYAVFMTFPPMALLLLGQPVWLIKGYAAIGSLFIPFLAVSLLYMNNRKTEMGSLRNGWLANSFLGLSLFLFVCLAVREIVQQVTG